jgi:lipoprotein
MSKPIKLIITLLTPLLFLTACSQNEQTEESNIETKQEVKDLSLEEKINNKQQYIVTHKHL